MMAFSPGMAMIREKQQCFQGFSFFVGKDNHYLSPNNCAKYHVSSENKVIDCLKLNLRTQDDEGSEGDDSYDDEDDNDGPAIVCSCTLGGPTVVIEAKTDNKVQENTSEGREAVDIDNQAENKVQDSGDKTEDKEGDNIVSDEKVVRFEVNIHSYNFLSCSTSTWACTYISTYSRLFFRC